MTTLTATNLTDLADQLNEIASRRDLPEGVDRYEWLLGRNALSSLPTFGGEDPVDTMGVYSWDANSYLVPSREAPDLYRGDGDWSIVPRSHYEA